LPPFLFLFNTVGVAFDGSSLYGFRNQACIFSISPLLVAIKQSETILMMLLTSVQGF
jgi:hypothetical protein